MQAAFSQRLMWALALLGAPVAVSEEPASEPRAREESPGAAREAPPPADPAPIFYLRDGSKVAATPISHGIRVVTRYGTLEVPWAEVLRLRLARRSRVDAGATSARARVPEQASSPGDAMEAIDGSLDEVLTRRFRIRGRVEDESFSVTSRYGALEFAARDLLGVEFQRAGELDQSITVDGTHTVPGQWVRTHAILARGQRLRIRASGSLHVSTYGCDSGPTGTTRYGSSTFKNFPMLALVAKIGANGREFLVGADYSGQATASGPLYLGVVPFQSGFAASGAYKVRIRAGD